MMDYETIKRAYAILSPYYDFLFDKVFYPGRVAAIDLLEINPGNRVLEVGVGTGMNLPRTWLHQQPAKAAPKVSCAPRPSSV